MIILDTNVLSELMRGRSAAVEVVRWVDAQPSLRMFTTAVTKAELLYGIERLPAGARRDAIAGQVETTLVIFEGRILSFDTRAAEAYASLVARCDRIGKPIAALDAQIAAIALSVGASVATRNMRHFEHTGLTLIDPWSA